MALAAAAVDPGQLPALAHHFAALPPPPSGSDDVPTAASRGEDIARHGRPAVDVPACLGCHGRGDRNPNYPRIAGQPAEYIATQLKLFREGRRGGTDYSLLMANAARGLSDADIEALAAFFSTVRTLPAYGKP